MPPATGSIRHMGRALPGLLPTRKAAKPGQTDHLQDGASGRFCERPQGVSPHDRNTHVRHRPVGRGAARRVQWVGQHRLYEPAERVIERWGSGLCALVEPSRCARCRPRRVGRSLRSSTCRRAGRRAIRPGIRQGGARAGVPRRHGERPDLVFRGTVTAVAPGRAVGPSASEQIRFREVTIRVDEVVRSTASTPASVLVEEEGWLASGVGYTMNDIGWSAVGDTGYFFLHQKSDRPGAYRLTASNGRALIAGGAVRVSGEDHSPWPQGVGPDQLDRAVRAAAKPTTTGGAR